MFILIRNPELWDPAYLDDAVLEAGWESKCMHDVMTSTSDGMLYGADRGANAPIRREAGKGAERVVRRLQRCGMTHLGFAVLVQLPLLFLKG